MLYWIYLQQLLGYGAANTTKVLKNISDPKLLVSSSADDLFRLGFSKRQIAYHGKKLLGQCQNILKACHDNHIKIIPYISHEYPKVLKQIYSPPVLLYAVGEIPNWDSLLKVSVVGPREISENGAKTAFSLSARLALANALIVSGGAIGGDSFAHKGALAVNGKTVAVTGGGLISGYLQKNKKLRIKILKSGGLLLTEFAPDYIPKEKSSFHLRNRVLAGLSDITVVIEAGERSGTLITAHQAADAGREVYVIANGSENFKGSEKLLSEGATPLNSIEDIVKNYNSLLTPQNINDISPSRLKELYGIAENETKEKSTKSKKSINLSKTKPTPKPCKNEVLSKLTGDMAKVYSVLTENGMNTDEVVETTGLNPSQVLGAITRLEIFGHIKALPGARYSIK